MSNNKYPAVIEKERANLAEKGARVKEDIEKKLGEARGLLKKDPDFAKAKTAEAQKEASLYQLQVKQFQAKLDIFDQARLSYAGNMQIAEKAISYAISRLAELKEKGYLVFPDEVLSPVKNELKIAQNLLEKKDDVPDYLRVIKHAEGVIKEAITIQNFWQKHCDSRASHEAKLADIRLWRETSLPRLENFYQTSSGNLKMKTPQDVWEPIIKEAGCGEAKIKLDNLIKEAERLNGMEKQDFATAGVIIEKIQTLRSGIETKLERPAKTLQEFAEAQIKAKNMASQASGAISRAERAVSDSDAEGAGRDNLQKAKGDVSRVKYLEKSDLPNWLLLAGLLAGAITLAQTAEREANSKAEEVERARRTRRYHSSHSSSSWSSGSSIGSSGGGGGFGGFGGGSFGGGGASGGW